MGKPSIFSKEYERRMKRRKKTLSFLFIIFSLFIGGIYFTFNSQLQKNIKEVLYTFINNSKQDVDSSSVEKNDKNILPTKPNSVSDNSIEEKFIEVKLPSKTIKLAYEEENGKKRYQLMTPLEQNEYFDISPSAEKVIINDSSQLLLMINNKGDLLDITNKSYKTISDGKVILRQTMLKTYNGYIWSIKPKFINDNTIVYLSQLPWFGRSNLNTYVWILDLNSQSHRPIYEAKGKNITFGQIKNNGIEVEIDGTNGIITAEGNFIKN